MVKNSKLFFSHILVTGSQSTKSTDLVNKQDIGFDRHKKVKRFEVGYEAASLSTWRIFSAC
jgi:hypothetical protein